MSSSSLSEHARRQFRTNGIGAFSLAFAAMLLMGGCQTPRYKEFASVQKGMSKGQILELTGSPTRTQRWHGRDRWTYVYEDNPAGRMIREVHFEDGYSTYVGPQIQPEVSADEQDQINERRNREAAEAERNPASFIQNLGYTVQRFTPVPDPIADSVASPAREPVSVPGGTLGNQAPQAQ